MGLVTRNVVWTPNSDPQRRFLELGCFEALYGGAAGGGKSAALLASLLRFAHLPGYNGILFRRTYEELESYIIPRAEQLYPRAFPTADYNRSKHYWTFPSGARIRFSHMQYDEDALAHKSAEYQQACFDELTSFSRFQYTYIISRLRSTSGIPILLRAGTNPGDEGHEWVFERFAPWLDPDAKEHGLPRARPGQVLHYVTDRGGGAERWVPKGTARSRGRAFVPAFAADNPALMENDPGYVDRLTELDPVAQAQLIDGNWTVKLIAGSLFKRTWFEVVEQAPLNLRRVRFWDRAATRPTKETPNPDWTRGCLLGLDEDEGYLYVEDMKGLRDVPGAVRKLIETTAEDDGRDVMVGLWQDPAAAGKFEIAEYVKSPALRGWEVRGFPQSKDKITYARPVSAQAFAKKIRVVRGPWNRAFFEELEGFPDPKNWKDDQVDSLSGGYVALTSDPTTVAQNWLRAGENL